MVGDVPHVDDGLQQLDQSLEDEFAQEVAVDLLVPADGP